MLLDIHDKLDTCLKKNKSKGDTIMKPRLKSTGLPVEDFATTIRKMLIEENLPLSMNVNLSSFDVPGTKLFSMTTPFYLHTDYSYVYNRLVSYTDDDYEVRQYGTPFVVPISDSGDFDVYSYVVCMFPAFGVLSFDFSFCFYDVLNPVVPRPNIDAYFAKSFPAFDLLSFDFSFIFYDLISSKYAFLSRDEKDELNYYRAAVHSKNMVSDLIRSNPFEYFWTLTFDPEKVSDRYDDDELIDLFRKWMFKINRRKNTKIRYLAIPERHKDGALHFHVLTFGALGNLRMTPSGLKDKSGSDIFNIDDWEHGFSTSVRISDGPRVRLANYVTKYITKSFFDKDAAVKPRYVRSRGLSEPVVTDNISLNSLDIVPTFGIVNEETGFLKYGVWKPDNGSHGPLKIVYK